MLIAFEGPDKVGKSTSADNVSHNGERIYNMTKANYLATRGDLAQERGLVQGFDRIDWLTHMAYRLALPEYDWHDDRVRTVFAAPDVHLVFKLHDPKNLWRVSDELYSDDQLPRVNAFYTQLADHLVALNETLDYSLFKTITILKVINTHNTYNLELKLFSSPVNGDSALSSLVEDDSTLLSLLRYEDQTRL